MFYSSDQKHRKNQGEEVYFLLQDFSQGLCIIREMVDSVLTKGILKLATLLLVEPFHPSWVCCLHGDSIERMCFFRALKYVTWIKNILQSCQPQRHPSPPTDP